MPDFAVKPLGPLTWADFAAVVERHNGVWGGCWCLEFHAEGAERNHQRRSKKECRVRDGTAHAALVDDGGACIGWCHFSLVSLESGRAADIPQHIIEKYAI